MTAIDQCDHLATRRRRRYGHFSSINKSIDLIDHGASSDCDGIIIPRNDDKFINAKKPKRRKGHQHHDNEPPFYVLVLQVGATLFIFSVVTYFALRATIWKQQPETAEDDDSMQQNLENEPQYQEEEKIIETLAPVPPTAPPLPVWELGTSVKFDAFGIAERYEAFSAAANSPNDGEHNDNRHDSLLSFWKVAKDLRDEFANYYGGENAARAMLERGLITFGVNNESNNKDNNNTTATNTQTSRMESSNSLPSDVVHTACRIRNAKQEDRPFVFAFGGYSVTAGRGNYFSQSFPFFMRDRLALPFSTLSMDIIVKNAAIGGCSAFPYGWCMSNFWPANADVVSWDYAMNEAGGIPHGLEAYLRHSLMLQRMPKIIVKDTNLAQSRQELLRKYLELGLIRDPVVILSDPAAQPFLQRKEEYRPKGFQEWRKFGAPLGAPGQAYHHPAVKEHEMMGWMLVMHFLSALELVAADAVTSVPLNCESSAVVVPSRVLPPPVTVPIEANKTMVPWTSLLFGQKGAGNEWTMNPIQCRTTFEPIIDGDMRSIVVGGSVAEDLDVMLPKSEMFYNQGWVYDLSKGEKESKRKLDRFGGLGFVDIKKAYYGVYSSGTLWLLLPTSYTNRTHVAKGDESKLTLPKSGDDAQRWFRHVVICQVNEKREVGSCNIEKDLSWSVGGVNVTKGMARLIDSAGVLYLGQKICVHLSIPQAAKLTTRESLIKSQPEKPLLEQEEKTGDPSQIGLSIGISVRNHHIMGRDFACSISHVVWEEASLTDKKEQILKSINQEMKS